MKQKTKMYLKLGILFFGISLCVINCQKDDDFLDNQNLQIEEKYKLKTLTLEDLKQKEHLYKSLNKLSKHFEINKASRDENDSNEKVDANDGSFSILTDEIIQVTTDSTETYSFLIETPTVSTSEFENLVVQVNPENSLSYYIYRFESLTVDEGEFPYNIDVEQIPNSLIDLQQYIDNDNSNAWILQVNDICYEIGCITSPRNFGCSHWVVLSTYECGGGSTTGDNGFSGNNGGFFGDGSGDSGSDGSGGGGGSTSGNTNDPTENDPHFNNDSNSISSDPMGINEPSSKDEVIDCLGGEANLTPDQLAWLNSTDSNIQYIIKQMAH